MSSYITPDSVNFCLVCFDALLFGKYSFKTWHTGAGEMTQWLKASRFGPQLCPSPQWLQVFLGIQHLFFWLCQAPGLTCGTYTYMQAGKTTHTHKIIINLYFKNAMCCFLNKFKVLNLC